MPAHTAGIFLFGINSGISEDYRGVRIGRFKKLQKEKN